MEKILVVDDERSLREVLSIMLTRAGYAVTEASDGEEAISHVNREIFDLVITDLRMPKADGMAVLKAVKSSSPETVVAETNDNAPSYATSPQRLFEESGTNEGGLSIGFTQQNGFCGRAILRQIPGPDDGRAG